MNPVIGIIGGKGKMGQFFKKFFERNKCTVLLSDLKTKLQPKQLCEKSDIVIISVPIHKTNSVITSIGSYVKKNSLLMDLTSIKEAPVKAMLQHSKSEVLGCHPIFGPHAATIKNQIIVLCPARRRKWFHWIKKTFERNGAEVKITTAKKHDEMMAIIQGIIHFSSIAQCHSFKQLHLKVKDSLSFSSPVYKIRLDVTGRILNQDPELYADIELENPYVVRAIDHYIASLLTLQKIIKTKNRKEFIKYFKATASYLGTLKKDFEKESNYLITIMAQKEH